MILSKQNTDVCTYNESDSARMEMCVWEEIDSGISKEELHAFGKHI